MKHPHIEEIRVRYISHQGNLQETENAILTEYNEKQARYTSLIT